MMKNRYLFYVALVGIAFAIPSLMTSRDPNHAASQSPPAGKTAPAAPAAPATAAATPTPAAPLEQETLATIETSDYSAVVSSRSR